MRPIHLVLFCLLGPLSVGAQNLLSIDSLRSALALHPQEDSVRASTLYQLSREYWDSDLDSAFNIAGRLLALSRRISYHPGAGNAYNSMGVVRWYQGNYPDAQHYHELALRMRQATGRKDAIAASNNNLGLVHDDQGNYPQALKYYLEAMRLYEAEGDSAGVAQEHSNIAVIHFNQKSYPDALAEHDRALRIREAMHDRWALSETYSNIGITYYEMKRYEEAEAWYDKALALRLEIDDQQGLAVSYNNYGELYREEGRYAEALAALDKAQAINERLGYRKSVADVALNKSKVYLAQGDLRRALDHQQQSLRVAEEVGSDDQALLVLGDLASTTARLGDFARAYDYRVRYEQLHDSIFNQQRTRSLVQQQMRYDFDKQQLADSLNFAAERTVQAGEIRRQKLVRNGFILGFGLMVAFAVVFFFQRNRIGREKRRGDELLHNILPDEVATELMEKGEAEARYIESATVLFTDFKGFTTIAEQLGPKELVKDIHACFSAFDRIIEKHGIEKIKTIGDAYMAAGGLPTPTTTHAQDVVRAAFEIRDFIAQGKQQKIADGLPYFEVRIGVHTGPVVAGIVGVKKFAYDIWGDTVNTASRMESSGEVGRVNISESTYALVKDRFTCTPRGRVEAKNKGWIEMYFAEEEVRA